MLDDESRDVLVMLVEATPTITISELNDSLPCNVTVVPRSLACDLLRMVMGILMDEAKWKNIHEIKHFNGKQLIK